MKRSKAKTQKSQAVDKSFTKKRKPTKTLYTQKLSAPLKRKRKSEYDAKEEARYVYNNTVEDTN